jgi:uncharacterized membrane protein YphA (DoxX/SURF4 family)
MTQFHVSPPAAYAVATILVQLLGSAMLIVSAYRWLGAIALSSFTALTIPVTTFWNQAGADGMTFFGLHYRAYGGHRRTASGSEACGCEPVSWRRMQSYR